MSPFQIQLNILQNAINNLHTLSDPHAETLSQTDVSCSYVLYILVAKNVPFQRHVYNNDFFYSKVNSGDTNSCYHRKCTVVKCLFMQARKKSYYEDK